MNIIELYAVLVMGLLGFWPCIILLFRTLRLSQILMTSFERWIQYPLAIKGAYRATRLELLLIFAFISCNIFVMAFRLSSPADFERRSAVVSAINVVPLFVGGNPNPLFDLISVSTSSYHLIHYWIGGVAILEGLIHAGISIQSGGSFPMFAMWHSTRSLDGGNEIGFLLSESERVFNHSSFKIGKGLRLDGPYGRNIDLGNYESVILAAKGMGIAGILSSALFLLDRHNLDTLAKKEQMSFDEDGAIRYTNRIFRDQTRKIVLIWILEDNCQEDWAAAQIRDLQKIDTQAILHFWCIYPSEETNEAPFHIDKDWQCHYSKKGQDERFFRGIISQATRSPGKHVVMTCGDSIFTGITRKVVIELSRLDNPIRFVELDYRPGHRKATDSELRLQEQGDARQKTIKKTGEMKKRSA
ncbi:hypothetical protein M0657_010695 [Pyricularia oryzae]|uniref:Ferric oxidoreductase domain-containing protein n=1 Tax=Pyricularia grisea TaxID=148305 RepID=A0A6P8BK65_PYRGI|nr:uncharacterized protein PgNI_01098 [Pyricularia grisea]KAI7911943.1 hypothetical protein M0657_010695 [Pyricularia oryzae]TLD17070.1 hypothetical protein PgNI_01098 [Pyricularia grisea]